MWRWRLADESPALRWREPLCGAGVSPSKARSASREPVLRPAQFADRVGAAAWPGAIKVFPEEFENFIEYGRSMVDGPVAAAMLP